MNTISTITRAEFKKLSSQQQIELISERGRKMIEFENEVGVFKVDDFVVAVHPAGPVMTFKDTSLVIGLFASENESNSINALQAYGTACLEEQDYEEAANIRDWMNQIKYQDLVMQFVLYKNLSESDRHTFYELHKQVKFPNEQLEKYITYVLKDLAPL